MKQYICTRECFIDNRLVREGALVLFDEDQIKGNPCFRPAEEPKPEKKEESFQLPTMTQEFHKENIEKAVDKVATQIKKNVAKEIKK